MLRSEGLWPYPQTLNYVGEVCQVQSTNALAYLKKIVNYGRKFFYNIGCGRKKVCRRQHI